jgi:hypothetical protein
MMKKLFSLFSISVVLAVLFISCTKEYSLENGGSGANGATDIVGVNCRISKIDYYDSASAVPLGSIAATIDTKDSVRNITLFDSLNNIIVANSMPFYSGDTAYLNPDEYFVTDPTTSLVIHLHGVLNSVFPSIPFECDYIYNADGTLFQKRYDISGAGVSPAVVVEYSYYAGNLVHMMSTDYTTVVPELIQDADLDYYLNIKPRNYINLMPDETISDDLNHFSPYTQFFNFGTKSTNAIKSLKVRFYDPGNVARDSVVSNFFTYITSRDNYVLSVYMLGDDQESLPAIAGRLNFSYSCKP